MQDDTATASAAEPAPSDGTDLVESLQDAGSSIGDTVTWAWDLELLMIADVAVTPGKLVLAASILLAAWVISFVLRRGLTRVESRADSNRRAALYAVGRMVHYVLLVIGAMLALEVVGIEASRFAVVAGAIGVGLGFGLQAIFNNFISGLILLFDRSLKVGDFVELESGVHGEVRDIKIRATRIVTNDNIDILVPNSEFVSGRVVNWTHRDVSRRMRIPFGVAYGSEKERVKLAGLEAAAEVKFTLEQDGPRGPQVWLSEFGDSSLNFELIVWLTADAVKRPGAVRAAYNWALESALAKHGLEIPFPQRDLHIRSWTPAAAEEAEKATGKKRKRVKAPKLSETEKAGLARNDAVDDLATEALPPEPPPEDSDENESR